MSVIQVDFKKLKKRAEDARWTPALIAKETGLTSAGIYKILNGEVDPGASNLKKICDTIGVPIQEAFTEAVAA